MTSSIKKTLLYALFLNFGIFLMSVGIYFFKTTNNFATGGVSGLSIIFTKLFPLISQATYMMIINIFPQKPIF
jgi:uncharacterized membrane-anchored protein YitT (DUF2179 family)